MTKNLEPVADIRLRALLAGWRLSAQFLRDTSNADVELVAAAIATDTCASQLEDLLKKPEGDTESLHALVTSDDVTRFLRMCDDWSVAEIAQSPGAFLRTLRLMQTVIARVQYILTHPSTERP